MIGRGNRQLLELFKKRFEEDGGSYLFRPKSTAPAVRVTRAEFEEATDQFRRAICWQSIGLVGALVAVAVLSALVDTGLHRKTSDWETWSLTLIVLTGFMLRWYVVWTAPTRDFGERRTAGPALSRAEARARALQRMSWWHFGFFGLAALAFIAGKALDQHLYLLSRISWGLAGTALVTLLLIRAKQKWEVTRRA